DTSLMMRFSPNFLHALVNACRGASSRATFSSRPEPRNASTRATCFTFTPPAFQLITSPKSGVPAGASSGTAPLADPFSAVMAFLLPRETEKPGPLDEEQAGLVDGFGNQNDSALPTASSEGDSAGTEWHSSLTFARSPDSPCT